MLSVIFVANGARESLHLLNETGRHRVDGWAVKIMGTAMFYSPIYTILLVVIHNSKNKTKKVDGFAVIFDGIQLSQ